MIALQLLELQTRARQWLNQMSKTLVLVEQAVIAGVELLTLRIVDAQVERITVDLLLSTLNSMTEVFKGLQALETRQAAHHRQNARVEGTHQFACLAQVQRVPPEREQLDQFVDEILARLAGEGHYGHRIQLKTQIVVEQQNTQNQRGGLTRARAGNH
ncbi:hypothetical protein D3C72_813380 [compost metagenome]